MMVCACRLRWKCARFRGYAARVGRKFTLLVVRSRSPAETFDAALYSKCVEACALEQDFEEWAEGDRAIIGAKGEQKQGKEPNGPKGKRTAWLFARQ